MLSNYTFVEFSLLNLAKQDDFFKGYNYLSGIAEPLSSHGRAKKVG